MPEDFTYRVQIALSGILEIDLAHALIAFEPYTAASLKNVAKSLAKERLKPNLAEAFGCIVGDWGAFAGLRNNIAHSRWTLGDRPDSIKPRGVSIRKGHAKFVGDDDGETSYTVEELNDAISKLHAINERLKDFLRTSGLEQIIASRMTG